ncbi:hypothetical protein EJB06_01720 [Massilia atriviolacea]|uniref:Uncharacterized protein n=1 Tax=Massilia atriviolacea TaxID=2495579 RepID=A0A430HTT0_9BURK|nr:hypothetical protein EJB06_01720 [Massilia atriviolacea]
MPAMAYEKNTPELVYRWLEEKRNAVPGKIDEFSSTADRAAHALAVNDALAGVAPIAFPLPCYASYDGDKKMFRVERSAPPFKDVLMKAPAADKLNMRKLSDARRFISREETRLSSSGTLVGQNKSVYYEFVLGIPAGPANEPAAAVVNPDYKVWTYTQNSALYVSYVSMPAEQAREQHKQIACLAVLSVQAPYVFTYTEGESSDSFPKRYTDILGFGVFGKLDRWAVVNKASGETYVEDVRTGL